MGSEFYTPRVEQLSIVRETMGDGTYAWRILIYSRNWSKLEMELPCNEEKDRIIQCFVIDLFMKVGRVVNELTREEKIGLYRRLKAMFL